MSYRRYGGFGGAVFCAYDSSAKFNGCVFEGNSSTGGLTGVGGTSAFAGDVPEPDRALNIPNAGGAVYAMFDSALEFNDCVLSGNTASTDVEELPHTIHVGFGGAVAYQYDCTAKFTNCTVAGNNASDGGGIYANESSTLIQDWQRGRQYGLPRGRILSDSGSGPCRKRPVPGNHATSPSFVPPVETTFLGQGGGLYAGSVGLYLKDTVLVENAADFSGGGLFLRRPRCSQ